MRIFRQTVSEIKENFFAEQSRWLAWVPFLFGFGIAVYFALPFEPNYWYSLGIFEVTLLLFYLLRHKGLHLLFTAILLVEFGFMDIQLQTLLKSRKVTFTPEVTDYIKGQISAVSYSEKGRKRLLLQNAENFDEPLNGKYRVTVMNGGNTDFEVGQCVELVGTFFPPSPVPVLNGFQLNRKYFYEEIIGIGYANSSIFVIDCEQKQASSFRIRLNKIRQRITDDVAKILPPDEAGIVDAVLIGEQSRTPKFIVNNYRDSGLAHFLSVSGLHMGAIAGLMFFVLRFLLALFPAIALRYDVKKLAAVGAILFSGLYLLVSGMAIPAERAFIMTAVVLLGVIFNRQAISMRMVCFAGLMLLIISPQALISISFQMSFAAVVALIAFYEKYAQKIAIWSVNRGIFSKIFFYLAGIVICDFVASLATMPFAIYHFHRVSVYTSLANLLAGPLIGLILMPLILLCLVALPLGLALYPLQALGYGVGWLNRITEFVSALPHSVVYVDSLPFWGFALIVCGGYWLCVWQRKWRLWGMLPILIGISTIFFGLQPDMVFAPKGEGIALRNKAGEMLLMPLKTDSWTVSVWRENLHLKELNKEQKAELKKIFAGSKTDLENITLKCDAEKCVYLDSIEFSKQGNIRIDGKNIDNSDGGYIFKRDKTKVMPLQPQGVCRPWRGCIKQERYKND